MWLRKQCSSGVFRAVAFETDLQKLRILAVDDLLQEYDNVPVNIFHSFPSGETGASYYLAHVRGQFGMRLLPLQEWSGVPVFYNFGMQNNLLSHVRYNYITKQLLTCHPHQGACFAHHGVPWQMIDSWPDNPKSALKYFSERVLDLFEKTTANCETCKFA